MIFKNLFISFNLLKDWPESSGLDNVADFWLATLPLALPPKIFLHFSLHYAILSQKVFGGNAIRVAFASLESLGQDKTFKSLESLVRLFQKVSKLIIS